MNRSYKMITLQAMLNLGQLPGSIKVPDLSDEICRILFRSPELQQDFSVAWDRPKAMESMLRRNPLHFLSKSSKRYFDLTGDTFSCFVEPASAELTGLIQEIVDWRLADYFG